MSLIVSVSWTWLRRVGGTLLLTVGVSAYIGVLASQALANPADLSAVTRFAPAVDLSRAVDALETAPLLSLDDGVDHDLHGLISAAPTGQRTCASAHRDVPWQPDVHLGRHLRPASRSADDTPG